MAYLLGDLRTIYGPLRHRLWPVRAAVAAVDWSARLDDPDVGEVRLGGRLREPVALDGEPVTPRELVVLVHGLGGSPESFYCEQGAAALAAQGVATLALSLRGADRRGDDFYNIALTADLHAAIASPELARYETLYVLGYSMGGYVALHYACEADPRVRGVAALCTPIDLLSAQRHIDRARAWPYRMHVLRGLVSIYEAVAARRPVPTDVREVQRVRTMYDWDRLTIAPRYGFDGPEHYYEALGIARRLGELSAPALLIACESDPVVPAGTILPFLGAAERLEVRWVPRGGHLSLPRGRLADGRPAPIELEALEWLRAAAVGLPAGRGRGVVDGWAGG